MRKALILLCLSPPTQLTVSPFSVFIFFGAAVSFSGGPDHPWFLSFAVGRPLQNFHTLQDCAVHARIMEAIDVKVESRVKVIIHLGPETYLAQANKGHLISEQLNSVKEQSMSFLKDFITKHNIPSDIPDEPDEISSEDDDDKILSPVPPVKKSKNLIID
ncbi:hypothetical protein OROGR_015737 [Orobanche gracilis]